MDILISIILSMHFNFNNDYNQIHPHIRVIKDNLIAGAFLNSESNVSVYGGINVNIDKWFVDLGAVTGYTGSDVLPFVRAGVELNDNFNIFVAPGYEVGYDQVGVVTGLELKF